MLEIRDPMFFWGTIILQFIGLASVVIARIPCRCPLKSNMCRGLFLACLTGLAVATMAAIQMESVAWTWYGTTFALMAIGVSLDLRSSVPATGF